MLHYLNIPGIAAQVKGMEISMLERQRLALQWQQEQLQVQQQYQSCLNESCIQSLSTAQAQIFQGLTVGCGPIPLGPTQNELLTQPTKTDPQEESRWIDFGMPKYEFAVERTEIQSVKQVSPGYGVSNAISGITSCPALVAASATEAEGKERPSLTSDHKLCGASRRESFKKRKAEKKLPPKGDAEDNSSMKKSKGSAEEEASKITDQKNNRKGNSNNKESSGNTNDKENKNASGCMPKDSSKASEVHKFDYIHVRARRGQATDSHSLAERVRREKISARMKYLQDLVPGCNKITGKAGMLDEIINYVQSLQRQVEFLSMKLATINPRLPINIEEIIPKQVLSAHFNLPTMGVSPELTNPNYLHRNHIQQLDPVYGTELEVTPIDMGIRRTIGAPVSFIDQSWLNKFPSSLPRDGDLQNIYTMEIQQGRSTSSQLHTFTGTIEASSLKMET